MTFEELQKEIKALNNYTIKFGEEFRLDVISKMYCSDCGNPYLFDVENHNLTNRITLSCYCDKVCKEEAHISITETGILSYHTNFNYIVSIINNLLSMMYQQCPK